MVTRNIKFSDLSGTAEAERITIGYGEDWYELDLVEAERDELETLLDPYLKAGRKLQKSGLAAERYVPNLTKEERVRICAWAKKRGYRFSERGQTPNKIVEANQQAHSSARQAA